MMIAAELRGGGKPSLNEALGWIGSRVDDIYGIAIGRLEDIWIDPATGEPRWLLVKEGRFGGRSTLVPFEDATAGEDSVWVPYERDVVREAPQVEPAVPLTQQVEATLRNHYAANAAAAVSHEARRRGRESAPSGAPEQAPQATQATVRLAPPAWPEAEPVPPPRLPERPPPPVTASPDPGEPAPGGRFGYPSREPGGERGAAEPVASPYEPPARPYRPPAQQTEPPSRASQPSPPPEPPRPQPSAPDPLAALAGLPPGYQVEIELTGGVSITGELRSVRIVPPDPGR